LTREHKYVLTSSHQNFRCHTVYDIKHAGGHKARLIAGGHPTDQNTESFYSSVVSLCGIRLVVNLAELDGLDLWGADVENAYLEAKTKEKVYIVGGPEFGELEGHTLIVDKALYGLRSSGLRLHERLADILRSMGSTPCKAEADIWMRENDGVYEYVAVYINDLLIAARDPEGIVKILREEHKFKLKAVGTLA
jgi:Reverse transcriptase (RNA-dependent DNA polymerase)